MQMLMLFFLIFLNFKSLKKKININNKMETIEKEFKKQKQEQKNKPEIPDDIKVKEYVLLVKKVSNIKNPIKKQALINNYIKKFGTLNKKLNKQVKKLLEIKKPEDEINDEDELRLMKAYRKAEKFINLLRKIEETDDPFKIRELRKKFEEEYGDIRGRGKIIITKEDRINEETNIRNFLISVKEFVNDNKEAKDKEEIVNTVSEMIENFSNEENLEVNPVLFQNRRKIFKKLMDNFGIKMIIKFIDSYLEQDENLEDFYYEYVNLPEIRKKINKIKIADTKTEKITDEIVLLDKEENEDKKEKKSRYGEYKSEHINQKCIDIYSRMPWLPYLVRRKYIYVSEPTTQDDINSYIIKNKEPLKYKGSEWYQVNKYFNEFLCSVPMFEKVQNDDVLTIKNINIKIGYKTDLFEDKSSELTDENFIIQNEEMFENENKYIKNYNLSQKEKIHKILEETKFSIEIVNHAKQELSKAFQRVSNFSNFYSENSEYVDKVLKSIIDNSKDVKRFIEKISNIVVYLSYEIDNVSHRIFSERIRSQYYLPEILVMLSPEEKLPEILGNPDLSDEKKERLAKSINIRLNNYIDSFTKYIYNTRNPYENIKEKTNYIERIHKIPLTEWKEKCSNYEDIKDIPNEDLLYYDEKGTTYCLNIRKIWKNFKDKNYKNPYTKKKLSKEFINNFQKTYNIIEEEKIEEPTIAEEEEEYTPDLIKLIEEDLNINYVEEPEPEPEIEKPVEEEYDDEYYKKYGPKYLIDIEPKINELYSRITNAGYLISKGEARLILNENDYDVDDSEKYYYETESIEKKLLPKKVRKSKTKIVESESEAESDNESETGYKEESEDGSISDNEESETGSISDKEEFEEESYKPVKEIKVNKDDKICKNCMKKCNKEFKSFIGKKLNYFCKLQCMEDFKF